MNNCIQLIKASAMLLMLSGTLISSDKVPSSGKKSVRFDETVHYKKIKNTRQETGTPAKYPLSELRNAGSKSKPIAQSQANLAGYQDVLEPEIKEKVHYDQLHGRLRSQLGHAASPPSEKTPENSRAEAFHNKLNNTPDKKNTPSSSRSIKRLEGQISKLKQIIQTLEQKNKDLKLKGLLTQEGVETLKAKKEELNNLNAQHARALDQAPHKERLKKQFGLKGRILKRSAYNEARKNLESNADYFKEPENINKESLLDDSLWGAYSQNRRLQALKPLKKENDRTVSEGLEKINTMSTVVREHKSYDPEGQKAYDQRLVPDDLKFSNMVEDTGADANKPVPNYKRDNPQPKKSILKKGTSFPKESPEISENPPLEASVASNKWASARINPQQNKQQRNFLKK